MPKAKKEETPSEEVKAETPVEPTEPVSTETPEVPEAETPVTETPVKPEQPVQPALHAEPIKRESKGKFEIIELSPTKYIIRTLTEKLIGTYEDSDPVRAYDKAKNALFGMTRWDR